MTTTEDPLELLAGLLAKAKAAGAEACDAVLIEGTSLSHSQRLGVPEHLERSEDRDLGLRVLIGRRQAMVSSSDFSQESLDGLAERAVAMARVVPEDPYCGLAEAELLAGELPQLDICEDGEPGTEVLIERAARTEEAARAVAGVTNSEGAEASWRRSTFAVVASNGFAKLYSGTRHGLGVSVLAGEGTAMESDYDSASAVHGADLASPEEVGRKAGERAVRRLNPRKVASAQVPVVYDPRVANSLLRHLSSAVNGAAVARGTSFLKDKLGQRIFPVSVRVLDDPLRRRGLRSRPFDGEGVAGRLLEVIDNGVLGSWITDLRSARQLGTTTTGHGSRGTSSPPSPTPTNLYLEPGPLSPSQLIADIDDGFYVTELIGFGVSGTTGDYSRGAGGLWIEGGELSYPVSEVTVAGNLNDMFANLTPADDLEFRYGTNAPTVRIEGMTVAGS